MIQLPDLHRRAREALVARGVPLSWSTADELDSVADAAIERLRTLRSELATGPVERACAWFDRALDTDATEYLDRPDYPEERKLRQVRLLHAQNRALRSYGRILGVLLPALQDSASRRSDGRARVLELACGSGELSLEIARLAASDPGCPGVRITGSDVVQAYVDDGNRRARALGLDIEFRKLDAFALEGVALGELDVALIAQSMHHFSPGQLARMIARVGAVGARRFVGIDGRRSLFLLAAAPMLAAVTLQREHTHDAFVSARKMYTDGELALIAEVAAPGARVRVRGGGMGLTVLDVEYEGAVGAG